MFIRAILAWLVILILAVLNGGLREGILIPQLGESIARILSPIFLSLLIFIVAYLLIPWIQAITVRDAWFVGLLWLALTLAFEFLAGHYLFGDAWEKLIAEYNVTQGKLWVLVPISTLISPVLVCTLRDSPT